jgi:hypothetical protein
VSKGKKKQKNYNFRGALGKSQNSQKMSNSTKTCAKKQNWTQIVMFSSKYDEIEWKSFKLQISLWTKLLTSK